MTFTGTGTGLASIIAFIATTIGNIFLSLDYVQFSDLPVSVLDVYLSIIVLEIIINFILEFLHMDNTEETENTQLSERVRYDSSSGSEDILSSARAEEIDFSSEIVHE